MEKLYVCENGVMREYTAEEYAKEQAMQNKNLTIRLPQQIREQRNGLLKDCDWTQISDATVDKQTWATYRQALRDITAQAGFPTNVQWPTKP
jgi:hypothetical protein